MNVLSCLGVPKIFSSITRSADINKTPDVRTRAIVPKWACKVDITYVRPVLNHTVISNLFATAGITMGVGDWRPEKVRVTMVVGRLLMPMILTS
jgi:hypothetical protein